MSSEELVSCVVKMLHSLNRSAKQSGRNARYLHSNVNAQQSTKSGKRAIQCACLFYTSKCMRSDMHIISAIVQMYSCQIMSQIAKLCKQLFACCGCF